MVTFKISTLPIANYMTAYPISAEPHVPITNAIKFMAERGFGNLIVSDGINPNGVLTEREILKVITESRNLDELTIKDVGWQPFIKLSVADTVLDAAHLMNKKKSRLLIFDNDKMVGIVTISDLLRAFRRIKTEISLARVFSTKVEKCNQSDSIFDAVKIMHEKRIGSVIIQDIEGYGIFTERDLLTCLYSNDFKFDVEVRKYASSPLIVADESIMSHQAATVMAANNIKRLGITKDDSLIGIVTARDLLDAYQDVYQVINTSTE